MGDIHPASKSLIELDSYRDYLSRARSHTTGTPCGHHLTLCSSWPTLCLLTISIGRSVPIPLGSCTSKVRVANAQLRVRSSQGGDCQEITRSRNHPTALLLLSLQSS